MRNIAAPALEVLGRDFRFPHKLDGLPVPGQDVLWPRPSGRTWAPTGRRVHWGKPTWVRVVGSRPQFWTQVGPNLDPS